MDFLAFLLTQCVNALSQAALLFFLGVGLTPILVGLFGTSFELSILRRLYRRDGSAFLMVTFGLALILGEVIRLLWGSEALQVKGPAEFTGVVFILDEPFPIYRLFLAAAGVVVALAIWQF